MPINEQDLLTIREAINQGGNVWDNNLLIEIKRKIKTHFLGETEECCYCRRSLHGEFTMVIDIEHVLPKSLYNQYMFELFNLNVSCKRCNMLIKRDRIDFIRDLELLLQNPENSDHYLFIHPNLDNYFDHIDYFVTIRNLKKSIKYIPLQTKGRYAYEFFELEKLEIETLNQAQGIKMEDTELVLTIPKDLVAESTALLNQL